VKVKKIQFVQKCVILRRIPHFSKKMYFSIFLKKISTMTLRYVGRRAVLESNTDVQINIEYNY